MGDTSGSGGVGTSLGLSLGVGVGVGVGEPEELVDGLVGLVGAVDGGVVPVEDDGDGLDGVLVVL